MNALAAFLFSYLPHIAIVGSLALAWLWWVCSTAPKGEDDWD